MGKILHIDADDIQSLAVALEGALLRKSFESGKTGSFTDDEEPDIDPFLGIFPSKNKRDLDYPYIGRIIQWEI